MSNPGSARRRRRQPKPVHQELFEAAARATQRSSLTRTQHARQAEEIRVLHVRHLDLLQALPDD